MATFEQLRISLDRGEAGPLIQASGHEENFRTRRQFLEAAFAEERRFAHSTSLRPFEFVPLPIDGDYVAGIFKRSRPLPAKDHALEPYEAENYEGAIFILSISKDQIVWMQENKRLGSSKALLDSFFAHVRSTSDIKDWNVYVQYLRDETEYWDFIETHHAQIAKLTFTFLPPNALGAKTRIADLLRVVQGEGNPDIQQHVYKSSPGKMKPESPTMAASAQIAMQGGGEAEARGVTGKVLYKSSAARKITSVVPDDQLPNENEPKFIRRVRDWLFPR